MASSMRSVIDFCELNNGDMGAKGGSAREPQAPGINTHLAVCLEAAKRRQKIKAISNNYP